MSRHSCKKFVYACVGGIYIYIYIHAYKQVSTITHSCLIRCSKTKEILDSFEFGLSIFRFIFFGTVAATMPEFFFRSTYTSGCTSIKGLTVSNRVAGMTPHRGPSHFCLVWCASTYGPLYCVYGRQRVFSGFRLAQKTKGPWLGSSR